MEFEAIVAKLKEKWPDVEEVRGSGDPVCLIPAEQNVQILRYLKTEPDLYFDSLMSLAGADSGQNLWVVYPLHSLKHLHKIIIKAVLPREEPEINSVVSLWGMADFFEREAYDLYGIRFLGHPDLRRILNPPDWQGWPGRKDYEYPMDYQGIPTTRSDQFFADAVSVGVDAREKAEKQLVAKIQADVKKELEEKEKAQTPNEGESK